MDTREVAEDTINALLDDDLDFEALEDDEVHYLAQQALVTPNEDDDIGELQDEEQKDFARQQLINLIKTSESTIDAAKDLVAVMREANIERDIVVKVLAEALHVKITEADHIVSMEE